MVTMAAEAQAESTLVRDNPARRATDSVRHWIESGLLPAGEPLPAERALATRVGVSRTALRAALQTLELEGLLRAGNDGVRSVCGRASQAPAVSLLTRTVSVLSEGPAEPPPTTGLLTTGWQAFIHIGAAQALRDARLHMLTLDTTTLLESGADALLRDRPLGVIALRQAVENATCRQMLLNLRAHGGSVVAYGDIVAMPGLDTVCSDHERGAYELTHWLLQRGCRRILRVWAYHWDPAQTYPTWLQARDRGYERALREAGTAPLPPVSYRCPQVLPLAATGQRVACDAGIRLTAGYLADRLAGPQAPDALMVISDGEVPTVAAACRLLGKTPNRDVALVGYDNYWRECPSTAWEPEPPLATVDKKNVLIGRELVNLLLARLHGQLPAAPQQRTVTPELVVLKDQRHSNSGRN